LWYTPYHLELIFTRLIPKSEGLELFTEWQKQFAEKFECTFTYDRLMMMDCPVGDRETNEVIMWLASYGEGIALLSNWLKTAGCKISHYLLK
jgi:hypothetical protein